MVSIKKFEEIIAWQKARELNAKIYFITNNAAISKDYGLRDQMRRSSISVMSNIAEGFERKGDKEFLRFLSISKSSCAELKSQLYAAYDVKLISVEDFEMLISGADEVSKLIQGFKSYLKKSKSPTNRLTD